MALDPAEVAFYAGLQRLLSRRRMPPPKSLTNVCAVDAAYAGDRVVAVASLFESGVNAGTSTYVGRCAFPYASGLFFLREGPFAVEAVKGLPARPQLVCFDAHGAAHPRAAGLATICGMVLGIPSVGLAKSLLVGRVAPGRDGLDKVTLEGKAVGFVTEDGPIRYWSPGYSVSLRELELLIRTHGRSCVMAMRVADRTARAEVRAATSGQP